MEKSESGTEAEELVAFIAEAERLEALPRTGWLVSGVNKPESIASHQYGVALIALWIADRVDRSIDVAKVMRIALLHDISEARLTDLPKPVKDFIGSSAVKEAEQRA